MLIEKVAVQNFRCFGDKACEVSLNDGVTALVGENGVGKTAFLEALKKLFSPLAADRRITRDDFHFGPEEEEEDVSNREMSIDVFFAFPELAKDNDLPGYLAQIGDFTFSSTPGSTLKARLRLEATWVPESEFRDEVESQLYWLKTEEDVDFGPESVDKLAVSRAATDLIRMRYIPATRDGGAVTRVALAELLRRIERSADWDDNTRSESSAAATELENKLRSTPAFTWLRHELQGLWRQLHSDRYFQNPDISVVAREFDKLIRELELVFERAPGGGVRRLEELSEGLISLLYFALSTTLYRLERSISLENADDRPQGFSTLEIAAPALTIFAVEEPENHLSPFYLPRLIELLNELSKDHRGCSIVTSHSAAILRRVHPSQVRHFRLGNDGETRARAISVPADDTKAEKYIRQAVLAHPELYFAKLAILGEGDTESLVIPAVADAMGVPLDPSFVAFVPLNGRHANHLWRLLDELEIPYLTLLDLDAGRKEGGPGRIRDALNWIQIASGTITGLEDYLDQLSKIDVTKSGALKEMQSLLTWLEEKGVFYSAPLDLDMAMLRAFPTAYEVGEDPGLLDKDRDALLEKVYGKQGHPSVAKSDDLGCSDAELIAYRAHFKARSKPTSHMEALSQLSPKQLQSSSPNVLTRLVHAARRLLPYDETEE